MLDLEQAVSRDHRWWSLADLDATSEPVYPESLAEIVRHALAKREEEPS